ncbi:MAG: hypothetical protein ACFFD4_37255, partial [Candidatus Odinarchaeota archaeon]
MRDSFEQFLDVLANMFLPLAEIANDPILTWDFLRELGFIPFGSPRKINKLTQIVTDIFKVIEEFDESEPSEEDTEFYLQLLQKAVSLILDFHQMKDGFSSIFTPSYVNESQIAEKFAGRLFNHLFVQFLARDHPVIYQLFHFLGIIEL